MDINESTLLKGFSAALLLLIISGFANLWLPLGPVAEQSLSLLHLVTGILSSGITFWYGYRHTRQTLAFRRLASVILGSAAFAAVVITLVTGVVLAVTGVTKANQGYKTVHDIAAYAVVALLLLHLLVHVMSFPERRLQSQGTRFKNLDRSMIGSIIIAIGCGVLFSAGLAGINNLSRNAPQPAPVANYSHGYGEGKFLPSMSTTPDGEFVAEAQIANSEDCAACHQDTSRQWFESAHKHAADDPTYVRNINLLEKSKGMEATRYCEGCHAPVALLTGQLSDGGKHAGVAGTTANFEGVGCMSCHGITKVHSTQGNAGYHFQPRKDYLFENADSDWLKSLNHLAIKLRPKQHVKDLLAPVQQSATFCSACHSQFMDKSMNDWGWVKMQNEYLAWSNSKFNQSRDTRFTHPDSKNCQSCHMPMVAGRDMAADEEGKVASHHFVGANVMLAKQFKNEDLFEKTRAFLQQDKVSIYIVPPEDKQARQSDLFVNPNTDVDAKHPIAMYRGQPVKLTVLVNNHGVGHNFPGGTIDLNEAWIDFKIIDGQGKQIYSSGHLEPNGYIEPDAVVYKESPLDRHGKPVWRHDLFNMVGRSYINYIPAGATDVVDFDVTIPDWAVSPLNLSATLKFRKLNAKYQNWVEQEQEIKANPIIDISRDALSVPLLKTPSVVKTL